MKRILLSFIFCLALSACVKTVPDNGNDIDKSGSTVFFADYETVMMLGALDWAKGDRIGVFGSDGGENACFTIEKSGEQANVAVFYGPLVKGKAVAYHPYDKNMVREADKFSFILDDAQEFCLGSDARHQFNEYCKNSFACADADNMFHFRFPLGMLSVMFDFTPGITVEEISLSCENGLAGKMLVGDDCKAVPSPIAGKTISLKLAEGVPSYIGGEFTGFLFVLPPVVYETGSLTLNVKAEEETMKVSVPAITVERVKSNDFHITEIKVGTENLGQFDGTDGYLE